MLIIPFLVIHFRDGSPYIRSVLPSTSFETTRQSVNHPLPYLRIWTNTSRPEYPKCGGDYYENDIALHETSSLYATSTTLKILYGLVILDLRGGVNRIALEFKEFNEKYGY